MRKKAKTTSASGVIDYERDGQQLKAYWALRGGTVEVSFPNGQTKQAHAGASKPEAIAQMLVHGL